MEKRAGTLTRPGSERKDFPPVVPPTKQLIPSPENKPGKTIVKVGTVSVPVYTFADRWAIIYREAKGARRKTLSFKTEAAAKEEARALCIRIARGQIKADQLTPDERLQAVTARDLLSPYGLSLDVAARELAAALETTGGAGVSEMARFWARHHQAANSERTAKVILAEMIAVKKGEGLDSEYLRNVDEPLGKFATAFPGPIGEIGATEIRSYLGKLSVEPRTRNNIRASLVMLFRFARTAGDLADGRTTEAEKVNRVKVSKRPPKVYTAIQLQSWLSQVREEWLPWMALGAFAGIRTEEVARMDWSDIQWITKEIYIRPEVAKTGEGRYVPLLDNLEAWLLPHRKGSGNIFPAKGRVNLETARMNKSLRMAAEGTGRPPVLWDRNALRHSYGSHRLGIIQDLGKLTIEMGNSVAVNRRNYQNPRSRQQCVEYFNLFPASKGIVIPMNEAETS